MTLLSSAPTQKNIIDYAGLFKMNFNSLVEYFSMLQFIYWTVERSYPGGKIAMKN